MPVDVHVPAQTVSVDRLMLTADAVRSSHAAPSTNCVNYCNCFADDVE
ncbi:MAG: hypothetical protein KGN78_06970 [Actinomycetales bacterium]|nr:hypothetical protein [Actinomycetales bacterium]